MTNNDIEQFKILSHKSNGKLDTRLFINASIKQFGLCNIAELRKNFVIQTIDNKLYAYSMCTKRFLDIIKYK